MGDILISCFNRKMDFYLTAGPSPFPCIEITWIVGKNEKIFHYIRV